MKSSSDPRRTIVVVGAGYSGSLTAVNLLRAAEPAQSILLIERRSRFGRGLAYQTWDDNLLLNVPAGNMSALPDVPGHFVDYLHGIDPAFNAGSFVSRRIYGDYLEYCLTSAEQVSSSTLRRLSGEVSSVRRAAEGEGFVVTLAGGQQVKSDRVVLATGHFPPVNPLPRSDFSASRAYIANPWDFGALDQTDAGRPVAILGAGHTAVDVLFRLTSHDDTRKVYLISRRGLVTQGHRFAPKPPTAVAGFPEYLRSIPATLRAHVHAIRQQARERMAAGQDWRDVINGLRPHTAAIWQRLPVHERRKFLARILPFWDIHRHRLAPAAHLRLEQMLKSGQVENIAGRLLSIEQRGADVIVEVGARGRSPPRRLTVGAVVNCTGPNYDIAAIELPLIAQLRDEGLIQQDPLKLGLEIDADYQVVDRRGRSVRGLFYIGPMLKASFWEAIAIPELRVHATAIANAVLRHAAAPTGVSN
ncbi:MAG: FAD/NAD(P)-binding protein [Steroidobacteraceae bacterium]